MPSPPHASRANPVEAYFGPLRQLTPADSDHPNHTARTRVPRRCPRRRNANARHPDARAAQRGGRARTGTGKGARRGGRPTSDAARQGAGPISPARR